MNSSGPRVAVHWQEQYGDLCRELAESLALPIDHNDPETSAFSTVLQPTDRGLALQLTGPGAPGPVIVDFAGGAADYRRTRGGGELLVKAVGGIKGALPWVVDATAGLGRDSFVLASRGYRVTLCERSPVVAALLQDGLQRAQHCGVGEVETVITRMALYAGDANHFMRELAPGNEPGVVYIDPMFPGSKKSALVKKEMQAFQSLIGADGDVEQLLQSARRTAKHRVVVKRPRKGEFLAGQKPTYSVSGKAIRYDIYALRAYTAE